MIDALKHLPGRHDQRLHTPHAFRSRGVEFKYLGNKRYIKKNLAELNLSEERLRQMFWLPGADSTEITLQAFAGPNITVGIEWMKRNGDIVANANRNFDMRGGELIATNDLLAVHEEGGGLGSILYSNQIRILKAQGYKSIELSADSSIGRYAWARKGFDYAGSKADKDWHSQQAQDKFRKWSSKMGLDESDYGGWPTFASAKDVADFDPGIKVAGYYIQNHAVADDYEMHIGKAFMLDRGNGHGSWTGELILNE